MLWSLQGQSGRHMMKLCWAGQWAPSGFPKEQALTTRQRERFGGRVLDLNPQVRQCLSSFPKFMWAPWGLGIPRRTLWAGSSWRDWYRPLGLIASRKVPGLVFTEPFPRGSRGHPRAQGPPGEGFPQKQMSRGLRSGLRKDILLSWTQELEGGEGTEGGSASWE